MRASNRLAALLLLLLSAAPVCADDPPDPPPDAEPDPALAELQRQLDLLKVQKDIAEAQKAIAEANKAQIDAVFPADVGALTGDAKLEDAEGELPFEAYFLAYEQLGAIVPKDGKGVAESIAGEVMAKCKKKPLVIHRDEDVSSILDYQAFLNQLNLIARELDDLANQVGQMSPPAADLSKRFLASAFLPQAVSGALRSAIDIVSLFRTDLTFRRDGISVEEGAIVAAVVREITQGTNDADEPCGPVYYPAQMPPDLLRLDSFLMEQLASTGATRKALDTAILRQRQAYGVVIESEKKAVSDAQNEVDDQKAKIAEIVKEIEELKKAGQSTEQKEQEMLAAEDELRTRQTALAQAQSAQAAAERNLEEFNDAVSPAEAIGALYDGMRTALVARVDSNGGARDSPLGALLRTEKLYRRISKEGEGECENKVCTDGEESHGRTLCCRKGNAFILSLKLMRAAGSELVKQNLWFFGPAKVFHDGGVAVSYVLYDPDGGVASSGVHMRKADWRRAVLPKKNGAQSPGTVQDVQRLEQAVKDLEQELKDLKKKAEDGR